MNISTIPKNIIYSLFLLISFSSCNGNNFQKTKSSMDNLTSQEKHNFRKILTSVIQNQDEPTLSTYNNFWKLLKKVNMSDKKSSGFMKEIMTSASNNYMRYLYEDALWALKTGRPFKSKQREDYEKDMISKKLITEFRIKQNEDFISSIAYKKTIKTNGKEVLFTKEMITNILSGINAAVQRIDKLFKYPTN